MKKWMKPMAVIETFEANDYVAACLTVTLQCELPGAHSDEVESRNPGANGNKYYGYTTQNNGYHSICGDPSTSFVNDATGIGYENINGVPQHNRPISNVLFGVKLNGDGKNISLKGLTASEPSVGSTGVYYATWTSTDGSGDTWSHMGIANVSNIDNNHPSRS